MSVKTVNGARDRDKTSDAPVSVGYRATGQLKNDLRTTSDELEHPAARSRIAWYDRITLGHYTRVIFKGFRSLISEHDLVGLDTSLSSGYCSEVFERKWLKEQKIRARKRGFEAIATDDIPSRTPYAATTTSSSPNTIWGALIRSFWPFLARAVGIELILTMARLLPPFVLGELIEFIDGDSPAGDGQGYFLCLALFCSSLSVGVALEQLLFQNLFGGLQARSALMTALYQKSLLLAPDTLRAYPIGEQLNLMSIDVENVFEFVQRWHLVWAWILRLAGSLGLLWVQLGPSCLAGFAVMCATMPLSGLVGSRIAAFQGKQMYEKGERLSLLTEILNGIKIIKLYAWEPAFARQLELIRAREVDYVSYYLFYQSVLSFIWNCTPFVISAVAFSCFVFVDNENVLTPKRVFVSLSLFNGLRFNLTFLPSVISAFTRCKVSLRRIQDFLQADELDLDEVTHAVGEGEAVVLDHASFAWEISATFDTLNLRIREGELVAVVGAVGAGKSSLLSAILGSMKKLTGHVHRKQVPIAYVPQQAWIQNDTVRRNVVFTAAFDSSWYHEVLDKCCLLPDLRILPEGDTTEIGEKGVNLSGGQKQRVSLARAVYQKAQLYLLDDPLSAVDAHVSLDLFKDVIGPSGLLKDTTRILVTHSQAVLPFVDRIVLIKDGRIDFVGTYEDLVNKDVSLKAVLKETAEGGGDVSEEADPIHAGQKKKRPSFLDDSNDNSRRTEERVVVGSVAWRLYWMLLRRFGILYAALSLMGFTLYELGKIASIFWLREWSNDARRLADNATMATSTMMALWNSDENSGSPPDEPNTTVPDLAWQTPLPFDDNEQALSRISTYLWIGSVEVVGVVVGCLFLALGCLAASSGLHNAVMNRILRAPLLFFDTTPIGRVVNRLSKDVDVLDLELYTRADGWIACVAALISALVIILVQAPVLLSVVLPCGVAFVLLLRIYLRNSRQMQRMASAKRSPVLNHFAATVNGSSSIRAFHAEKNFVGEFAARLDLSQNWILHNNASATWVSMRVVVLCSLVVLVLTLFMVYHRDQFGKGLAGLVITHSLNTIDEMNWIFRLSSWLEMTVIAAERLDEYAKVPSEKPWKINDIVDPLWPAEGSLAFNSFSTTYKKDQPDVLQSITLEVAPGTKVGVVGRTGAGKSSLSLALFRALEARKGSIVIDGVDISSVGLHDLRARLTMIPQDPVLFRGSLRSNLDPEEAYSDEELWSAIERAHLNKTSFSLKMTIADGGSNLSVGERQLVCLARALLRRSKVIVLDEATAAVDRDTDRLIQSTIRKDFALSTVITIAHRLDTVLDYDTIVVLSAGRIVEQGHPKELIESKNSLFYSMAKDADLCD